MKKILVLLAAFSITAGVASAQTTPTKIKNKVKTERSDKAHKTPEQKANHAAQRLSEKLGLSAEQTEKVRQLHLARYQDMKANHASATAGKTKPQRQEMKADKAQYDAQLKQILTSEQYAKFTQQRAEKAEKHKANRKAKG